MAITITKNKGEVIKFSGGVLKIKEVTSAGADLSSPDTVHDLGYIDEFDIQINTDGDSTITDEANNIVAYLDGETKIKLMGMMMQTSKAVAEFFRDAVTGKFYQIYYKASKTGEMNGKTQEFFAPIARIKKQLTFKARTKKTPFEATILTNDSAFTFNTTMCTAVGSVATQSIVPASAGFSIEET